MLCCKKVFASYRKHVSLAQWANEIVPEVAAFLSVVVKEEISK
jgi:hypothetical protein